MSVGYWDDEQRDEGTLTRVEGPHDGWYSVTSDNGWSCGVSAEYGVEPKVGDRFVTWGGIGFAIRGQAINGRVLYYRTPDEQRVEDDKQVARMKAEKIAEYEGKRSDFDARVAALPVPLRERVEAFRAFGGDNWRWEYEPYEMACCEEAARIAARFPHGDDIKAFSRLAYEQQKAAHPTMSNDHSGNTWGMSCRLAYLLVEKPELVAMEHAAICPLVGCTDAGCYAARSELRSA